MGKEIKIGILHSSSGSMAACGPSLIEAALMAIEEVNQSGGVLGQKVRAIVEDGCSDPRIYADKAEKLIEHDAVACIFGCWTSSSRKAVKSIVEGHNSLLWYPVQYEGLEQSDSIIYTGSCLNQQILPALDWCMSGNSKRFYLVGSDYVFPQTANHLLSSAIKTKGGEILGEQYRPLGSDDFSSIVKDVKSISPDYVLNTINGSSNYAFFNQCRDVGVQCPIMSFSLSELDLIKQPDLAIDHYACWSYFQTLDTPENKQFLKSYLNRTGNFVSSDPIVMAYSQIHLWSNAVKEAETVEIDTLRDYIKGQSFLSPAGKIEILQNNHIRKGALIGKARSDGQFDIVWRADKPIDPMPWLGLENIDMTSSSLIMESLRQYPEILHLNSLLKEEIERRQLAESQFLKEMQHSFIGVVQTRGSGEIVSVNNAFLSMVGYTHEEFLEGQINWRTITPVEFLNLDENALKEANENGVCKPYEKEYIRKDGSRVAIIIEFSKFSELTDEYLVFIIDITERKQAEEKYRDLYNNAPDLFASVDPQTATIIECNQTLVTATGYTREEILGRPIFVMYHPDSVEGAKKAFQTFITKGEVKNAELQLQRKDGSKIEVILNVSSVRDSKGRILHCRSVWRDITERKRLEQQLQQAQKMEAVGQLTGGIAHDFNNIMAIIQGNLELLKEKLRDDDKGTHHLEKSLFNVNRAAQLTQRLLAFSRKQMLQPTSLDLNDLVRGMHDLLQRTLGEAIEIGTVCAGGLWRCFADDAQVENCLLNLAINARDAMPEGGKLTIEAANTRLDEEYARTHEGVVAGQYVMLAVSDTGTGMSEEALAHAFEPFYTTKGVGKGSGLGLSMVYGFARQSGGHIAIYSEVGEGTTMKLYLPRDTGSAAPEENDAITGDIPMGQQETVLVVEDEPDLLEIVATQLAGLGYTVLSAKDGAMALEVAEKNGGIDVLLTDVILTGAMNGRDVAEALQKQRPALKVVYMSGYTEDAIADQVQSNATIQLLKKPFSRNELSRKIREQLDS